MLTHSIRNVIVCVYMYIICQLAHSANSAHASRYSLAHLHLSAAGVVQTRAKQWGVLYTNDEVCALSFII